MPLLLDTIQTVRGALASYRFCVAAEDDLQLAVGVVLERHRIIAKREVRLSPRDRVDFLTFDGVAIEVKVDGTVGDVVAQLQRYAASPRVLATLLVTTRPAHAHVVATGSLGGKPAYCSLVATEVGL